MQEIEGRVESLVMDTEQKLGTRVAEARSRPAPIWASILGHGASTGAIEELRLRPALPRRRRRDEERDEGPRDGRPHRSDKDRV